MVTSVSGGSSWTVLGLYAALVSLWLSTSEALDISYCSPYNNAGSYPIYYNEFQSNGACHDHCLGSYAFAVLQGYDCWCSNYIPAPQENTYNCNEPCPGTGNEWCGSTDSGLFGYYLLSAGVPVGTSASGASTPSSTTSPSSTPPPSSSSSAETSVVTSSSETSTILTSSTTQTTPTSQAATPDPPTSSTPSPTPAPTAVYTSLITVTGKISTVVVTPSATAPADGLSGDSKTSGGGLEKGTVAGIVVGVALLIAISIGGGVYFWYRRRQRMSPQEAGPETAFVPRTGGTPSSNNVPSRQVSTMSSSGLLGTKTSRANISGVGFGTDPRSADSADRRSLGTDQRLNPNRLYLGDEGRISNVSLQDNQDYSRTLRVANPD